MPRQTSSQWDFGELFPVEQTRKVFGVAELTSNVRRILEREFGSLWVSGEISNLRAQSSGHIYFTLKDASAQLNCVLFRSERVEDRHLLEDGRKIIAQGTVTVYEARGQYQLRVTGVEFQGAGALQIAFEKLKKKLQAEGLFAPERKRPLPRYPQRIGIVTSREAAALQDVLHVIGRRNPGLEIILRHSRVQGEGAAAEIAEAIGLLNEYSEAGMLDLILLTRGGGSLEDLWAFNEEVVARAIAASAVPVVSAVGHEIDFTIADFVADVRAATPSAAAEIITEGVHASRQFVMDAPRWMARAVRERLAYSREALQDRLRRLGRVHPRLVLDERLQRLDDVQSRMLRNVRFQWRECHGGWEVLRQRFARLTPRRALADRLERIRRAQQQAAHLATQHLRQLRSRLERAQARLKLLSPENVLQRGYSITTDAATGRVVRSAQSVKPGQRLKTRLQEGEVESTVDRKS